MHLFADRLEIFSPGTIPDTMTIDSLSERQSARNELLTSLPARCPMNVNAMGRPVGCGFRTENIRFSSKPVGCRFVLQNEWCAVMHLVGLILTYPELVLKGKTTEGGAT